VTKANWSGMGLRDISFKWVETLVHLKSVDLSHSNLLVILLLPTAPRLRFMDLEGNRIGGLIIHERIEYRMLGNPVESAVLNFDRRRMLDRWNELIAPQSIQIEGPINVPLSFLLKMSLRHLLLDKANVSGSIPRSISNLQSLELLRLRHNQITGTIPTSIGKLASFKGIGSGHLPNHWNFS
jgi:Leucine-rich repeat (LRR) protein